MKDYTCEVIMPEELGSQVLKNQARFLSHYPKYFSYSACRITIEGEAEVAYALWVHETQRLGISFGDDTTWETVSSIQEGIEMWLDHPEEWERCN